MRNGKNITSQSLGQELSGLIVAIGLRRAGIDDFVLYERDPALFPHSVWLARVRLAPKGFRFSVAQANLGFAISWTSRKAEGVLCAFLFGSSSQRWYSPGR